MLREEFAFLFQTFSRSDPPGKAPLTRGRSVFEKKEKGRKKGRKFVDTAENEFKKVFLNVSKEIYTYTHSNSEKLKYHQILGRERSAKNAPTHKTDRRGTDLIQLRPSFIDRI